LSTTSLETTPSGRPPAASTVAVRLATESGFFDFGLRMGLLPANPASDVRRPVPRPPEPRGLRQVELEAAWDAVHEALPGRWHVGPVTYDPGRHAFSVTARGRHPGRGKMPQTVSGTGEDEIAALRDLDDRLRGVPHPDGSRLEELRRRLRLAYVEGAEEWTRENRGRSMTTDELERVTAGYPGRL
jgi:hypothetical protein